MQRPSSRPGRVPACQTRDCGPLGSGQLDAAFNLARWLSPNDADARDIVLQACLDVFGSLAPTHGDGDRLLGAVRWLCHARWRRESDAESGPGRTSQVAGPVPSIDDALYTLPFELREVVVLRDMEDLGYGAIASIIGMSVGSVVCRLVQGRTQLARQLGLPNQRVGDSPELETPLIR